MCSFYFQAMKEVCQDMFFSRSRSSPAAQSMLGTASPRPVLENALTGAVAPDDKVNAIGELVDMKVDAPTQVDFSDQVCMSSCADCTGSVNLMDRRMFCSC